MAKIISFCFYLIASLSLSAQSDTMGLIPDKQPRFLYNDLGSYKGLHKDSIVYERNTIDGFPKRISIDSSTVRKFRFQDNRFDSLFYHLNYDTLKNDFFVLDTLNHKDTNNYLLLDIEDSYLDCNFYINPISRKQTILFNNCVFSKDMRRIQIRADTVRFINCDFLSGNVTLEVLPANKKVLFELYRTDITNIRFSYPEEMELLFIRDTAFEIRKTVYERLLSKFRTEGKNVSYKNLNVEFEWWKAENGSMGSYIGAFLNQAWWNFGYAKGRVLLWTLFFLLLFSVFNLWRWKYVDKTYPIESISKNVTMAMIAKRRGRVFALVVLYTSFVFFSLNVDFKNLKIIKLRYTVAFFIQYLIGIACLIFITNAIIKF